MTGAVRAARVVHSSLQETAFAKNEKWHRAGIEFRSVDDHGSGPDYSRSHIECDGRGLPADFEPSRGLLCATDNALTRL
jgi:hypothetical protein